MAKAVWALEQDEIAGALCTINEVDVRAWLAAVWKALSKEAIARVVTRLWAIWHVRQLLA
jgi:hypothetical protein